MSNELQVDTLHAITVYFLVRNSTGAIWNTSSVAFEAFNGANYTNYVIAATEQGSTGFYTAAFPTSITTTGVYSCVAKQQAGGSAAQSDFSVGYGDLQWDGTNLITNFDPTNFGSLGITSTGRVSLNSGFAKNVAVPDFEFLMVLTDGTTPATGKTVTATRSIDGGAFSACANPVSELTNGIYVINLAASDLNGGVITLKFTATGCLDRDVTIRTDP